jgi:hypothetical protein
MEKEYYQKHRKEVMDKHREYRNKNREKVRRWNREAQRRKMKSNPMYSKENLRRWTGRSFDAYLKYCLSHCKNRGMKIEIDASFLTGLLSRQNYKCAITGVEMNHEVGSMYAVSIDRIDSSLEYTKENVQLVTQFMQYAKHTWSNPAVKKMIYDIFDASSRADCV